MTPNFPIAMRPFEKGQPHRKASIVYEAIRCRDVIKTYVDVLGWVDRVHIIASMAKQ